MSFLRRFRGSRSSAPHGSNVPDASDPDEAATDEAPDPAEQDREFSLLREDQARQDELMIRQQRYARYAWEPPRQGGERRADDAESPKEG